MRFYGFLLICFVTNLVGMDLVIVERMQMIPIFHMLPEEMNHSISFYLDLKGKINFCVTDTKAWRQFKETLNESQKVSDSPIQLEMREYFNERYKQLKLLHCSDHAYP